MFFEIFTMLCAKNGITPNKACTDCGISRTSVAKWKSGSIPNGATLEKVSKYFDVTTDYLLGFTLSAQIDHLAYTIQQIEEELKTAPPEIQEDLEEALAIKEESYEDLLFASSFAGNPKSPTVEFTYAADCMEANTMKAISVAVDQLNAEGQEKLVEYADDLVSSGKYKKYSPLELGKEA